MCMCMCLLLGDLGWQRFMSVELFLYILASSYRRFYSYSWQLAVWFLAVIKGKLSAALHLNVHKFPLYATRARARALMRLHGQAEAYEVSHMKL